MLATRSRDKIWILDDGPEEPIEPTPPPVPQGNPNTGEYQIALVKFKHALKAYDAAYGRFLALRDEYQAFGERPKRLWVFASDFLEMAERDSAAVARGEQRAPRYQKAIDPGWIT